MRRFAFRADSSGTIGSGHIVRCATLAGVLRDRGADIIFVCRELPEHLAVWLQSLGFYVAHIKSSQEPICEESDAKLTRDALEELAPVDCLVVDHYGLGMEWEQALRSLAKNVLVIDDFDHRSHDCDFLLNQNYRTSNRSSPKTRQKNSPELLLGPKFALVRPEFSALRTNRRHRSGAVKRILVCFGGGDPKNFSEAVLSALAATDAPLEHIDIVVGYASPHIDDLVRRYRDNAHIEFHSHVDNMAELLDSADLAIGAGGTMTWERACLGVPSIVFGIVDNQHGALAALIEDGFLVGVPEMTHPDASLIASCLQSTIGNAPMLRGLSRRIETLVDGRGAQRVADVLFPAPLNFRNADINDAESMLSWRNDPHVREKSLDSKKVSASEHRAWLKRTLEDPKRDLLIAECDGSPIGVVRFDVDEDEATISVYRVPNSKEGRYGLVRCATEWIHEHRPQILRVIAHILDDNASSLAAFRGAGYRDAERVMIYEFRAARA